MRKEGERSSFIYPIVTCWQVCRHAYVNLGLEGYLRVIEWANFDGELNVYKFG